MREDGEGDDPGLLELESFKAAEGGLGVARFEPGEDCLDGEIEG